MEENIGIVFPYFINWTSGNFKCTCMAHTGDQRCTLTGSTMTLRASAMGRLPEPSTILRGEYCTVHEAHLKWAVWNHPDEQRAYHTASAVGKLRKATWQVTVTQWPSSNCWEDFLGLNCAKLEGVNSKFANLCKLWWWGFLRERVKECYWVWLRSYLVPSRLSLWLLSLVRPRKTAPPAHVPETSQARPHGQPAHGSFMWGRTSKCPRLPPPGSHHTEANLDFQGRGNLRVVSSHF